jgi:hypothetical protein
MAYYKHFSLCSVKKSTKREGLGKPHPTMKSIGVWL